MNKKSSNPQSSNPQKQKIVRFVLICCMAAFCLLANAPMQNDQANAQLAEQSEKSISLLPPASQQAANVVSLYNAINFILIGVVVFVMLLLLYCVVRFNEKANPIPSKVTHNSLLEVVWTLVPVVILIIIAFPAFKLLVDEYSPPPADITIKATGNQWYWSYEYPDENIEFDSIILEKEQIKDGQPYLLAVDNDIVVPIDKVIKVLVTASDVLHSWAIPVFTIKADAVPGRINATWFKPFKTGRFYGQCSELCGKGHAYMPIAVRVVTQSQYQEWLKDTKEQTAQNDSQTNNNKLTADSQINKKQTEIQKFSQIK